METETTSDGGQSRAVRLLIVVSFGLSAASNLALARWFEAAFFLLAGFVLLKGKAIECWPRLARYLLVAVLTLMCVGMFVKLIMYVQVRR